jgi:SAM-dependent methyltransferase
MDVHRTDPPPSDVRVLLGTMDIYLVDQLMRGRIEPGMRVLEAGVGKGRNLEYFLRAGYDVAGNDRKAEVVEALRKKALELAPGLAPERAAHLLRIEAVEDTSFEANTFDVVVCNAVLHFARDEAHFEAMLAGAWRPLRPGGLFFARLASSIGLEQHVRPLGAGRFALPDGTERYLVDLEALIAATERLGGELLDPIKTTNVQGRRCMTTWVVRKGGGPGTGSPPSP